MTKQLVLKITMSQEYGYKHIYGHFRYLDSDDASRPQSGCQYGLPDCPNSYGEQRWACDLIAYSQANADNTIGNKFYGMGLRYLTHSVELNDAERMVKTLRGLESKLDKHAEKFGYVENMAEYLYRLAMVSKCKYILIPSESEYQYKAYDVDARGKRALSDFEAAQ